MCFRGMAAEDRLSDAASRVLLRVRATLGRIRFLLVGRLKQVELGHVRRDAAV